MSDFSLQVANTATKIPFEQLAKTRNNMIDMMNKDFERVLDTKDNQKIITWGKKVGELNNKCTNTIQNVTDRMKK
jgi:regulator of protease activity HflC (stomatin/prohibitin superfamily)